MLDSRGDLDVETLLKVALVLVVVWLGLEVVGAFFGVVRAIFGPLWAFVRPFVGLVVLALVVLWLLDQF